jgi:hypothetical protein
MGKEKRQSLFSTRHKGTRGVEAWLHAFSTSTTDYLFNNVIGPQDYRAQETE